MGCSVSFRVSASVPAAVAALRLTFFFPGLKRPSASGPFSGTVSVRPLVQTFEVAGRRPASAL